MSAFYKRVQVKLVELEKKRSWLLTQTGIKPSTWSSWEKNERYPPADKALRIADALGVSLEYLITGRQTPFDFRRHNPMVMQTCQLLLDMGPEQLQRALTAVNTIRLESSQS